MPLKVAIDCIDCPVCGVGAIMVRNNTIPRHEFGLRYVPYRLYHYFEKRSGTPVKEQAKKQLCPASGKSPEEARDIYEQGRKNPQNEKEGNVPLKSDREVKL